MRNLRDQIFIAAKLALIPYLGVVLAYFACSLFDCDTTTTGEVCILSGLLVSGYLLYKIWQEGY